MFSSTQQTLNPLQLRNALITTSMSTEKVATDTTNEQQFENIDDYENVNETNNNNEV